LQARDIIVIGGSAGALRPLRRILRALPTGLPAAIFVVIHTSPESTGVLPELLTRHSGLRAQNAKDGCMRVTRGPRENRFRPAVGPLFRTAATVYGPGVVGVILSGGQDDGVLGLTHIKRQRGLVVVQDPAEADSTGMPEGAIREVAVDHVLPADDVAAILAGLVGPGVEEEMGSGNDRTPRMGEHARSRGMLKIAESYERDAGESEAQAKVVRGVLVTDPSDTIHDPLPENQRS
jgi:two-component system chemotaxis response regulator CheB